MKKPLLVYIVLSGFMVMHDSQAESEAKQDRAYFEDRERGYYFYEDPIIEPEKDLPKAVVETPNPKATKEVAEKPADKGTYLEQLKAQGKQWEEQMALAILQPTRENVRAWMETHKNVVRQARTFSDKYEKTIWTTPDLDRSVTNPINTNLNLAENHATYLRESQDLNRMADEKGLLYFFRSDCPHCQKFSPILKSFAEEFGFSILPVTMDGFPVAEFPNPKFPGTMAQDLNVSAVPAVFLVDPARNEVIPAAWGFNTKLQLREKIFYAAEQLENVNEESDIFHFSGAAL